MIAGQTVAPVVVHLTRPWIAGAIGKGVDRAVTKSAITCSMKSWVTIRLAKFGYPSPPFAVKSFWAIV